jgi:hypothetical protein
MALRTFRDGDGQSWRVWLVQSGNAAALAGTPREWLCFQNDDDSERRRLIDFPSNWDDLSEQRLDLLRKLAAPVTLIMKKHSPPEGSDTVKPGQGETER